MPNADIEHNEWLSLIAEDVSGPFLSIPVLKEALPNGLNTIPSEKTRELSDRWKQFNKNPSDTLGRELIDFVLRTLLNYDKDVLKAGNTTGISYCPIGSSERICPDFVLVQPPRGSLYLAGLRNKNQENQSHTPPPHLLISIFPDPEFSKKLAQTASRQMEDLCRAADVPLGLVCNPKSFILVHAPKDKTTTFVTWDISLCMDERIILRAFVSLLAKARFFSEEEKNTLPNLIKRSESAQYEVTDQLGRQVRSAITEFIRALDFLDRNTNYKLLNGISPEEIYKAALTVMMRLVFVLCAEERGLLCAGNDAYDKAYAASTLLESLLETADKSGEEILESRHDAWVRLLALFRAIYGGISHEAIQIRPYGGTLFNPDAYPFLEGRKKGDSWTSAEAKPIPINNRVVLHMLYSIQFLQDKKKTGTSNAVRLSFRALDVEQIGHIYEGLLDRSAERTEATILGFRGGSKISEPWISLQTAQEEYAKGENNFVEWLAGYIGDTPALLLNLLHPKEKGAKSGKGQTAVSSDEDKAEIQMTLLKQVCNGNKAIEEQITPFLPLLRKDDFDRPALALEKGLYVTSSSQRRDTGTHYTPKHIAETLTAATLEPHVYYGPAEGLPKEEWKLKSADDILNLKVCDMTMGSGAFLVQACRYLADRLVEAWESNPDKPALPTDDQERLVVARRMIADSCLYGVDNNDMAIEMGKLSLWLTTMQKDKPFTFLDHSLRLGDSLMGVTAIDQLIYFHMQTDKHIGQPLSSIDVKEYVNSSMQNRALIASFRSDSIADVEQKHSLLQAAEKSIVDLRRLGDLLVMGTLEGKGAMSDAKRTKLLQVLQPNKKKKNLFNQSIDEKIEEYRQKLILGTNKKIVKEADQDNNPGFTRPFHWLLEFPEVFDRDNPGFDAIIGNPPFKGSQMMREDLGNFYREYIIGLIGKNARGKADLTAYFFLRAANIIREGGDFGLISTNTISQGQTRTVALLPLIDNGYIIRSAWPNVPWEGNATVTTSQLVIRNNIESWKGNISLSNQKVNNISSFLKEEKYEWTSQSIIENSCISYQGSIILGKGFIISEEQAQKWIKEDNNNSKVLYPLLNGEDITSSPEQTTSRWVINFFDWEESDAKYFPLIYDYILKEVKPIRQRVDENGNFALRKPLPEKWWIYADKRPALYHAIGRGDLFDKHPKNWTPINKMNRVLVTSAVSKYRIFCFCKNDFIMSHALIVFASEDAALFGILQSTIHNIWASKMGSALGMTLRYTPSSCFESFPRPQEDRLDEVRQLAEDLHAKRANFMKEHNIGLTSFYNAIHNPSSELPIQELRDLHEQLDIEVAKAYGWTDLGMKHDFRTIEVSNGKDKDEDTIRYTIDEATSIEILKRLTQLNKERYEAQCATEEKTPQSKTKATKKRQTKTLEQGELL